MTKWREVTPLKDQCSLNNKK